MLFSSLARLVSGSLPELLSSDDLFLGTGSISKLSVQVCSLQNTKIPSYMQNIMLG